MNFQKFNSAPRTILAATALIAGTLTVQANQAKPPRWDIAHICGQDALSGPCPRAESDARRAVLDKWNVVPENDRQLCMSRFDVDGKRSYRELSTCINEQAFKNFETQEGA